MAAVLYKTDIYVAGGYTGHDIIDVIDVIDTRADSVMFWGKLYEKTVYISPIVVDSKLYIFGGYVNNAAVDYWQYFDLFSAFNLH